jgi:AsmA protein
MKRLLFGLAFASGLAVAAMAMKNLISTDAVGDEIARAFAAASGIQVLVSGQAEVDAFPALRVRYRDARLTREADRVTLADMQELSVRLDILPLFLGRLAISEVTLVRPSLRLETSRGFKTLFPSKAILSRLDPGRIVIEGGTVALVDPKAGRLEMIEAVSGTFSWTRLTGGASLTSNFRWRGEPVSLNAQGIGPRALADGETGNVTLTMVSEPIRASFDGKGVLMDSIQLDGGLSIDVPDLGRLSTWLGPAFDGRGALKNLGLQGRMRSLGYSATISDARLRFDGNVGEGVISARLDAQRPQVRGTLAFERMDVSPYRRALSAMDWRAIPLTQRVLSSLDLDLRVSVARTDMATTPISKIAATLLLKDGRFDAELGEAALLGGTASLLLRGEAKPTGLRVAARIVGTALSVPALGALAGATEGSGGTVALKVDGEASGETLGTLIDSFSARASADARQVVLRSADAVTDGIRLVQAAVTTSIGSRPPTFERVSATADMSASALRIKQLTADGVSMSAQLAGEASLLNGQLALSGQIFVPDRAAAVPTGPNRYLAAPIKIGGTLAAPTAEVSISAFRPAELLLSPERNDAARKD